MHRSGSRRFYKSRKSKRRLKKEERIRKREAQALKRQEEEERLNRCLAAQAQFDLLQFGRLFHYRAMHPGELWNPLEESLMAFMARGCPSFWKDPKPYPSRALLRRDWTNSLARLAARELNLIRATPGAAD